jgi:hypothetical protein
MMTDMVGVTPVYRRGARGVLWPLVTARRMWTHAVADERSIRFNVRLLTVLTAVFSLPGITQGVLVVAHAPTGVARGYGAYILSLGLFELSGSLLLARRVPAGRYLIVAAALGFYPEAVLGLAGLERAPLAVAVFMVCAPAEAWVLWFLRHSRVRGYLVTRRAPIATP